jgi:hypothetical protein
MKPYLMYFLSLLLLPCLSLSCYSLSGNALPPHIKSVSVPLFNDESRSGISLLRENLTTSMTNKVQSQTALVVIQERSQASSVLEGVIASVTDAPASVSGQNERATTNRLTININATYRDLVKSKKIFQKNFSGFADYNVGSLAGRNDAIQQAINIATDNLINEMLSGW